MQNKYKKLSIPGRSYQRKKTRQESGGKNERAINNT